MRSSMGSTARMRAFGQSAFGTAASDPVPGAAVLVAAPSPSCPRCTPSPTCRTACTRRLCPRSIVVVRITCVIVILGLFVTLMFGRSLTAVILGVTGILFSLETLFAMSRGARTRENARILKYYAAYSVLATGASVAVGATTLSGVDLSCASSADVDACTATQVMYGLIMLIGSPAVGSFAAINSALVYLSLQSGGARDSEEDLKVAI